MRAMCWRADVTVAVATAACLMTPSAFACGVHDSDGRAARHVLQRALRLVTLDPGVTVRLIDPDLAADPDSAGKLDAFVVREPSGELRRVIYVNCRSEIVRQAAAGINLYVVVLAAVIHHEAAHVNGASEDDARLAEAEFLRLQLGRGRVSPAVGEAYLDLLARRGAPPAIANGQSHAGGH
jgi:hypothetical protein